MPQDNCLFCQIVKGEVPCFKIYEDKKYLAFLDVFPLTPGHTMVIPKQHFRWVWEVEPAGEYWEVIVKVARHYRKALGEEFLASVTEGLAAPHAHYHLLPASENLHGWFGDAGKYKQKEMISEVEGNRLVEKLGMRV